MWENWSPWMVYLYKSIALSRGESPHQTRRIFSLTLCMILIICNNSNNEFEERERLLAFDMQSLLQNENIGSKWRIWRLEISQNKSITYLRWIAVCDVEFKNKTSTNTRIPTWLNCTWVFFSVSFLPASALLSSDYTAQFHKALQAPQHLRTIPDILLVWNPFFLLFTSLGLIS